MEEFYCVKIVCKMLHVSRETIRRWEKAGMFPKRVRFSEHRRGKVGFAKSDVQAWIEARKAASA